MTEAKCKRSNSGCPNECENTNGSTAAKSSAEIAKSGCAELCDDDVKSSRPYSKTESAGPTRGKPTTKRELSVQAKLRREIALPTCVAHNTNMAKSRWACDRKDRSSSVCVASNAETWNSTRVIPSANSISPGCTADLSGVVLPMLAILKADGRRPGQLKDLKDGGRSACPESMVDTANPGLAQLCNEGENPDVTLPKSDNIKPIRLICTIERAGPR